MPIIDGPLDEVIDKSASDNEALMKLRAWEIEESPSNLGYVVDKEWPKLPKDWRLGGPGGGIQMGVANRLN